MHTFLESDFCGAFITGTHDGFGPQTLAVQVMNRVVN